MATDLSQTHGLLTDLFCHPQTTEGWQRYRLSQEQVDFYHQHGYIAGVPVLSQSQIDVLLEELARLADPQCDGHELFYEFHSNESSDPKTVLFHALGAWRIATGFHDLLWNPAFLVPAAQLLGGPVRFWHDQLFCKPARHGGVVAWHQDYSYWTRTKPRNHLTCWIGLDDATVENGCLHYLPGSHKWDLLPITGLAGDMHAIRQVLTPQQAAAFDNPLPIELKKGHAAFHHPLMVHGSRENLTDQPRRATVINVFGDEVISDSETPLLKGVPAIPKGQKMQGQFFPLLFDPQEMLG